MFILFKQKTAYEVRISDWSSDVCSSDLVLGYRCAHSGMTLACAYRHEVETTCEYEAETVVGEDLAKTVFTTHATAGDRKSVVLGKSVSVRVDLGGIRCIKKKMEWTHTQYAHEGTT